MAHELIVNHLRQISTLYQIKDDKQRALAASRAADNVEKFQSQEITEQNIVEIPYIGKAFTETILEFQKSGTSKRLKALAKEVDPQCLTMLVVKGIGPRMVWKLYQEEGIKNFDALVKYWKQGKLDERFDEPMKQAIAKTGSRVNHYVANHLGNILLTAMKTQPGVIRASLCGSVRRKKETSKDLDVLVSAKAKDAAGIIKAFAKMGKVISKGETKSSIWFTLGETTMQADLLVVPDNSFGAALQYFTGSREHNVKVRSLAQKLGYKVNEKGIYEVKTNRKVGGKNEEDIYNIVGMPMPEPENR